MESGTTAKAVKTAAVPSNAALTLYSPSVFPRVSVELTSPSPSVRVESALSDAPGPAESVTVQKTSMPGSAFPSWSFTSASKASARAVPGRARALSPALTSIVVGASAVTVNSTGATSGTEARIVITSPTLPSVTDVSANPPFADVTLVDPSVAEPETTLKLTSTSSRPPPDAFFT